MSSPTPLTHPSPPSLLAASPSVPITLAILILALLFLGFFSIFFCRCIMKNAANTAMNGRPSPTTTVMHAGHGTPVVSPSDPTEPPGLDPWIINSFPTFVYSSVMEYRRESYGLECAICISEFESDDMLRLLTKCSHVFHRHCVDLWLETQKSCPVCRCSLDTSSEKEQEKPSNECPTASTTTDIDQAEETVDDAESGPAEVEIVIDKTEEEDEVDVATSTTAANTSTSAVGYDHEEPRRRKSALFGVGRFSRSHSTGHSLGESTKDDDNEVNDQEDKYTLRLPEDVKERLTKRHMQTLSCTTFGEMAWSRLSYDDENKENSESKGKV